MNALQYNPVEYLEQTLFDRLAHRLPDVSEYKFLSSKIEYDKTAQIGIEAVVANRFAINENDAFNTGRYMESYLKDTINDDFDKFLDQLKIGEEKEEEVDAVHFCGLSVDEHKAGFQNYAFSSNFDWLIVSKIG